MNCPVCKRTLAPTLSICLTCGAMMNDSVREELQTKIGAISKPLKMEKKPTPVTPPKPAPSAPPKALTMVMEDLPKTPARKPVKPAPAKVITTELTGSKTSKTLVDFQNRNSTVPDWRLQLQNAVRTRKGPADEAANYRTHLVTSGANALEAKYVAEPEPEKPADNRDPRVAAALERIANSRKTFLEPEPANAERPAAPVKRDRPFNIVSRNADAAPTEPRIAAPLTAAKPRLVPTIRIEKKDLDTNKLPALAEVEEAAVPAAVEPALIAAPARAEKLAVEEIAAMVAADELAEHSEIEELDDLPPLSMRFSSGLFDMLIGSFASFLLLMPFVLTGGDWFSAAGVVAFVPTLSIVMFIYLTSALAFFGKSVGMRLFGLEMVDADANEYPTLHQSAVSSALYLLSVAFAGAGFLTVFFNEEKRAAHDLVSGTIIVKEF